MLMGSSTFDGARITNEYYDTVTMNTEILLLIGRSIMNYIIRRFHSLSSDDVTS